MRVAAVFLVAVSLGACLASNVPDAPDVPDVPDVSSFLPFPLSFPECEYPPDFLTGNCTASNGCLLKRESAECCDVITKFRGDLMCVPALFSTLPLLVAGDNCNATDYDLQSAQGLVCGAVPGTANELGCQSAKVSVETLCLNGDGCFNDTSSPECCAAMQAFLGAGCTGEDEFLGDSCNSDTVSDQAETCQDPISTVCSQAIDNVALVCHDENGCFREQSSPQCCGAVAAYARAGQCDPLTQPGASCPVTFTTAQNYFDSACDACDPALSAVEQACLDDSGCAAAEPGPACCGAMAAFTQTCEGSMTLGDGCTDVGNIATYNQQCDMDQCPYLTNGVEFSCLQSQGGLSCMASNPSVQCCGAIAAYASSMCSQDDFPIGEDNGCTLVDDLTSYATDLCPVTPPAVCDGFLTSVKAACVRNGCAVESPNTQCCGAMEAFTTAGCDEDTYSLDQDGCTHTVDSIASFREAECQTLLPDPSDLLPDDSDSDIIVDCSQVAASIASTCLGGPNIAVCPSDNPSGTCCGHARSFIEGQCDNFSFTSNALCEVRVNSVAAYVSAHCPEDSTDSASGMHVALVAVVALVATALRW